MPSTKSIYQGYTSNNYVELIKSGTPYFQRMKQMIDAAQHSIHLQVYILGDDDTGRTISSRLEIAVARGVKVYVLADGYASQSLSGSFVETLIQAGIEFRFFEPLFKNNNFYFGRRLHHKVFVADGKMALVGGVNIADRYNDTAEAPAWLDFALYVEGAVARELCLFCRKQWQGNLQQWKSIHCLPLDKKTSFGGFPVRIHRNDWVRRKNQISTMYLEMLRTSKKQVIILSAYFLPGRMVRKQLVKAVKRGVSVRIITAGKSDIAISKHAERWLYDWLLRNGVEIWEYQQTVLHGKMAVCDDAWMTVGSYNLNNLSAYASLELNLSVKDAAFTKATRLLLEDIISKDCIKITEAWQGQQKNPLIQLQRWLSYQLLRCTFYLFTFYYQQRP